MEKEQLHVIHHDNKKVLHILDIQLLDVTTDSTVRFSPGSFFMCLRYRYSI